MSTMVDIRNKYFLRTIFFILAGITLGTKANAQVQITPIALYMDDDNKTGRLMIRNTTQQSIEVTVGLQFAYPQTNDQGEVYLKKFKKVSANEPSATNWVRVYPPHVILPPQEQQVIRLAARPPQDLPDGEFWARPVITAQQVVENTSSSDRNITTRINMIKRTFLSLNYRHGQVKTGASIKDMNTHLEGGNLHLSAELERKGNAAYLGHIQVRVKDASGRTHKQLQKKIAIYHHLAPVYSFDIKDLTPGTYSAEVVLDTKERAKYNRDIIDAPRVKEVRNFVIK